MSKTVSIRDVVEVNSLLSDKGIQAKVHLRDACGSQSLWIEDLGGSGVPSDASKIIADFFSQRRIPLEFDESGTNFWAK